MIWLMLATSKLDKHGNPVKSTGVEDASLVTDSTPPKY